MSWRLATLLGLGIIAAACGSFDSSTSTGSQGAPASITTTTLASEPSAESWEVTVLGDSLAWLSGWPTQYADMVSAEFGVGVILGDQVSEAAADRCILVVDINALFTGPDYRQPIKAEYSNDGSHPSQEGSRVIAESLHGLGYEPTMGGC